MSNRNTALSAEQLETKYDEIREAAFTDIESNRYLSREARIHALEVIEVYDFSSSNDSSEKFSKAVQIVDDRHHTLWGDEQGEDRKYKERQLTTGIGAARIALNAARKSWVKAHKAEETTAITVPTRKRNSFKSLVGAR